jgi:hypothetical protein
MPMDLVTDDPQKLALTTIEDYAPLVGVEAVERILKKSERMRDMHIVNISSTGSVPQSCCSVA